MSIIGKTIRGWAFAGFVALAPGACGPDRESGAPVSPKDAAAIDARADRAAPPDLGQAPQAASDAAVLADAGSPTTDATGPDQGPSADAVSDMAPPPPLSDPTAAIKVEPIAWRPCTGEHVGKDCARVKVPLDYANPSGRQIELFVARMPAVDPGQRVGSLFVNPGGPGAGGVSSGYLESLRSVLTPRIRIRFDIVSWDPRGVPASAAVDCKAMPTFTALAKQYDHSSGTRDRDALVAAYARWVEQCKASAGDRLPFVGTSATVSDLELLRRAMGDAKLNYLGVSYGSVIGLHYYLRYPDRVRAMVLDAVEPIWPEDRGDGDQDQAFDAALIAFFGWCGRATARDCPFAPATPAKDAAWGALVMALAAQPVPAGNGRTVGVGLLKWGVSSLLYRQASWPSLATALEEARTGNGASLLAAAEGYLGQGAGQDPYNAIDCGDHDPVSLKDVDDYAARHAALRIVLPYVRLACVGWPATRLTVPPPMPAGPLPPIVLIGTTGDPATPYKWATAVKARLGNATLLTAEGYSHTAFIGGRPCIADPVNAYVLSGTIPAAGIRCPTTEPTAPLQLKAVSDPRQHRRGSR